MKGERFADGFLLKRVTFNHVVLFETVENFDEFVTSATLFFIDSISISLLNVVNTINFINAFKENDVRIRLFTFSSFFHGINFASKEIGEFISAVTAFDGDFFIRFFSEIRKFR